jgi:hypothetical protein
MEHTLFNQFHQKLHSHSRIYDNAGFMEVVVSRKRNLSVILDLHMHDSGVLRVIDSMTMSAPSPE